MVSKQEKYAQQNTAVPYCRGLELLNQAHNVIDVSWRTLPEAQEEGTIELAKAAQKMGIQPTSSYNGIGRWDSLENCQNNN
ncbi:hypothetical protein WKK05_13215 [Nostoc sp. UHCC 0302]|uniref:hypothetical protein n=1 Tax=Nostoc sp. UHCC 0302 TaxID=3134896 RepID=UPI00311CA489